ncbi:MAG: phosphodiesterase [Caldimonas sp.]
MPKLLVQLSDTHIRRPGQLAYRRVDTAAFLAQAVAAVLALPQAPAAVVVTGDLTDFGRPAEYAHLRALLAPLACPLYLLPGNHDDRAELRRAFPEHDWLRTSGDAFLHYAVDLGGLRLVAIDTSVAKAPHGELGAAQLAWLDAALAEDRSTPTVVAMHHPPFPTFIGHMDEIGLQQGGRGLAAVIARHPQVERIVCGHLHRSIQTRFAGTIAMTAPSTAHAVSLDLASDAASTFEMQPPGFLVHAWSPTGGVVSHLAFSGGFAGPFPFHDGGALID